MHAGDVGGRVLHLCLSREDLCEVYKRVLTSCENFIALRASLTNFLWRFYMVRDMRRWSLI